MFINSLKKMYIEKTIRKKYRLKIFKNNKLAFHDLKKGNFKFSEGCKIYNTQLAGKIEIGICTEINNSLIRGAVIIGNYTSINGPTTFISSKHNQIKIGNFTSIAHNVTIIEYNHNLNKLSTSFLGKKLSGRSFVNDTWSKGPIEIGNDMWIGAGSSVLSGVRIGNGAVIGANSIVNTDVPDYAIVAGNPAKIIRYRFSDDIIDKLNEIEWYNLDLDTLHKFPDILEIEIDISVIEKLKKRLQQLNVQTDKAAS